MDISIFGCKACARGGRPSPLPLVRVWICLPGSLFDPRASSLPRSCTGGTGEVVVVEVVVVVVVVVGIVVVTLLHSGVMGLFKILLQEMKRCEPSVAYTTSSAFMVISLKDT